MKKYLFLCSFLITVGLSRLFAQGLSVELTGMTDCWYVSNSLGFSVGHAKKVSFSSMNRLSADYQGDDKARLLSMNSAGYALNGWLKPTIGMMYASGGQLRPTTGVQILHVGRRLTALLNQSFAFRGTCDWLGLTMVQYTVSKRENRRMFGRLQSLHIYRPDWHCVSLIRFRLGWGRRRCEWGVADDLTLVGSTLDSQNSLGFFLQYKLF